MFIAQQGIRIKEAGGNVSDDDYEIYNLTCYVNKQISAVPEDPKKLWAELRSGSYICRAYNTARDMEFYAANYYISQLLKSDASRYEVAQWLGYDTYSYHYILRKWLKRLLIATPFIIIAYFAWKLYTKIGASGIVLIVLLFFFGLGMDAQKKRDESSGYTKKHIEEMKNRPVSAEDGDFAVLQAASNGKKLTESGWYLYYKMEDKRKK